MNGYPSDFKFKAIFSKGVIYRAIKAGNRYAIIWNFNGDKSAAISENEMQYHLQCHDYKIVME